MSTYPANVISIPVSWYNGNKQSFSLFGTHSKYATSQATRHARNTRSQSIGTTIDSYYILTSRPARKLVEESPAASWYQRGVGSFDMHPALVFLIRDMYFIDQSLLGGEEGQLEVRICMFSTSSENWDHRTKIPTLSRGMHYSSPLASRPGSLPLWFVLSGRCTPFFSHSLHHFHNE